MELHTHDDYTSLILRTTAKTVVYFFALLLLSVTVLFAFRPTVAVAFYRGIGQDNNAYVYTVKAGKTDAEWAHKAAVESVRLKLSEEEIAKRCRHFLLLDDGSVTAKADAYNLANSPAKAYDVVLFSEQNYLAEFVAKTEKAVFDGEYFVSPQDALTGDYDGKTAATVGNQLSLILTQNTSDVQAFCERLLGFVSADGGLESLYVLRSAARLNKAVNGTLTYQGQPIEQAYQAAFDAYCEQ